MDTKFKKITSFDYSVFYKNVSFTNVDFFDQISFKLSKFYKKLDLRIISSINEIDFNRTLFADSVLIGKENSLSKINIDFSRTNFIDKGTSLKEYNKKIFFKANGAKIILYGPVDIKMQPEKLSYIQICDTLDYFSKLDIINTLRYSDNIKSNTEWELRLDYLFAQSTKYQKHTTIYVKYPIFHLKTITNYLYDITMGLGYKPFRLFLWGFLAIVIFSIIFYKSYYKESLMLLSHDNKKLNSKDHSFLYCFYLSTNLFLSIKFDKNIIAIFTGFIRILFIFEWLLGILFYWYLLNGSKSGSLIYSFKTLFSI